MSRENILAFSKKVVKMLKKYFKMPHELENIENFLRKRPERNFQIYEIPDN